MKKIIAFCNSADYCHAYFLYGTVGAISYFALTHMFFRLICHVARRCQFQQCHVQQHKRCIVDSRQALRFVLGPPPHSRRFKTSGALRRRRRPFPAFLIWSLSRTHIIALSPPSPCLPRNPVYIFPRRSFAS